MHDYIIVIHDHGFFYENVWSMEIDLKALSEQAGKRVKDQYHKYNGGSFVDFPIPRAKKLLKLIWEYGTDEDHEKVLEYVKNKKLIAYWKDLTK